MTARFAAGCVIALLAGCRAVPPDTGSSAFAFVDAPPAPPPKPNAARPVAVAPSGEEFREATPFGKLAQPVYPPKALAAKAGLVVVGVRITVDTNGRVTDVGSSLVAFSTPGPWAQDFFAAVEAAVRQWRFRPAAIERNEYVQVPGLQPYSRLLSSENVETHFDLSFTFTESGAVRTGK